MHYSRLPSGTDSPMGAGDLPTAGLASNAEPSKPAIVSLSRENRRALSVFAWSALLVVGSTVFLVILQAYDVGEITYPVLSYYAGYLQSGGGERKAFFGQATGPVPVPGLEAQCGSSSGVGPDVQTYPNPPVGLLRRAAASRVISGLAVDDGDSLYSVTATSLTVLPGGGGAAADSLGTELFLTRHGDEEESSLLAQVPLLRARPADDSADIDRLRPGRAGRDGRAGGSFADTSKAEAAAASREPFLALAQLGMEASSKAPLVALRGSVQGSPTDGAASSAAPPSEAVSMIALLSADHDTGALRCVDSIDFVASQRSASKAVPAAQCVGPSSENPGKMNDVADPSNPTWFRPVAMAVGGCVHPASTLNTTCPASESVSRRASDLCTGQVVARDQGLPYSWVDAYVGGPRDNQMELVRVRIVVRRSSCDSRWTAVRLLQDWVIPHASPAVPLFWPLPVASASTVALFANASMVFASYPLIDPIGPHGVEAPALHGHRPIPMQIVGLNTTGRKVWQLTQTLPNVTGLASNVAVDEGGSLWVVATATASSKANATLPDRLGAGTSHWPTLQLPPLRSKPACNSSGSSAGCATADGADGDGVDDDMAVQTRYSLVSISPADGSLRRMDGVKQLRAKRHTPTRLGPLMQLAVSSNFVTFCEQMWVGFANMTEVHEMWGRSQRLPLTAGIGWGAFSLDDGTEIGHEGAGGSGQQLACVGDMIATDKAIFATVAESAEGPWLADEQQGTAVELDAGWSLPAVEAERAAGAHAPVDVQGAVLNLFAMASVTARGRVVWSSKSAASTDLLPAELGTLQFPGPWEPRPDGSTMSSPAPLGPGDETWAFFGTSARVTSALGTGRRLVSQRDKPMFVHTPAVPWTNESVDTAETVQRCSSLLPPSLVEGYTFLTVGVLLSMMARCLRGWCWATVFRVHVQGTGGKLPDDASLRLVKLAPHKCICLDCRLGQLEKHCRVRCCAVRCRPPCGLDPFVMHPHDLARHFDVLNIRTENLPRGSVRYRQGLAIVEPSLFKGHLVTRSGAKVHVRPRPTCRVSCTPREVLAVQAGSGELFRAVRTAGFNACCIDCRFALDRSAMTPSRGPRTDATQWQLITMFHATLVAVILVWTTVQATAGTAAFQAELAAPSTFFFEYLVNAPANPSAGCQNALEAACFCSTTHNVMRGKDPAAAGGASQLNAAGFPMHPYEAMARLGAVRGRCPCASSNACTKACDVMLAETGNCAAQAFPYLCQCKAAAADGVPEDCSATGMTVMTTNQLPSDAPLQRGLVACSSWYSGTSAILVAASTTVCLLVAGLLAAQLDTAMTGLAGKRAAHAEGKLIEPESDRSEGPDRDAAGNPAAIPGTPEGHASDELRSAGQPGRKFRPRVRSSSSDGAGLATAPGGHRPSNSGAKWGGIRNEVVVHGGRRGSPPVEQEDWDRTAGVVELGTTAPGEEEDEKEMSRAIPSPGGAAAAASVGFSPQRQRRRPGAAAGDWAGTRTAGQTVPPEQTGWSHKWDTSVHGTARSSDPSSGESSDAGVARELAEARRLEGREPAFVAARRLELQSSLLLNLPQITLKTRMARLAQRQQSSNTIDVFDHRDVEALEQQVTDDAEEAGTAATAKMEGSTLAGITLRDEEDAMVKAVARDEGSFTRFAVATVVLLAGSSLLAAAAVQLYQALAVGRHCTQEGNLADTPVATSVEASQSALLRFIPACTFSAEWRDRDPEGRVTRLGTVGLYAVAVALIVLLLDPLTMVLQLCCRLRNAWLLHPRRLAVLLSRREPLGEGGLCLRVLSLPISMLGAAVRLLLLPVTLVCCPGSRSTVGPAGLPKAMWGGDVVLCCSPQWTCAAWCYVPQHPCICGCGCCTAICCFDPGKKLRNRKMPAEVRRSLIARKLAKQLATSTVV